MESNATPATQRSPDSPGRRRTGNWWFAAVAALAVLQLGLYLVLRARPGLLGVVLWYVGPWAIGLIAVGVLGVGLVMSALRRPFWSNARGIAFLGLAAIMIVSGRAYRVYPSSYDDRPSEVGFRLPLDGAVTVAWGGATRDVNYHVVVPDQRWAYDLLVTRDGASYRDDGTVLEHYHAYDRLVRSPAAGRVVSAVDGRPDHPIGTKWDGEDVLGNHVVVQLADSQYLFVAHLRRGTVAVRPKQLVQVGTHLGHVGNSGRSTEPHVHVHLQNTPDPYFAEGIPMYFEDYLVRERLVRRGIPTGGVRGRQFIGQIIEHADSLLTVS